MRAYFSFLNGRHYKKNKKNLKNIINNHIILQSRLIYLKNIFCIACTQPQPQAYVSPLC